LHLLQKSLKSLNSGIHNYDSKADFTGFNPLCLSGHIKILTLSASGGLKRHGRIVLCFSKQSIFVVIFTLFNPQSGMRSII
jgi:hypothetical protein